MSTAPKNQRLRLAVPNWHSMGAQLIWIILILVVLIFSLTIQGFATTRNFINILYHCVFLGVLVIGQVMVLITGKLDLSSESVLAFAAMLCGWLMGTAPPASGWGVPPVLAIIIMIAAGTLIGYLNGVFIVKLGMHPFIVTLAAMIIFRGATVVFTNSQAIVRLPAAYRSVATASVAGIPALVFILLALYVIAHLYLSKTQAGRHLFAVGGSPRAAYAFGIDVDRVIMKAYAISGAMAAVAGWFLSARMDGMMARLAEGMTFEAIAAAVIGGVSLAGGTGSMVGAFAGVLLLGSIDSALNLTATSPYYINIARGLIIFLAVLVDALRKRATPLGLRTE